MLRKLPNIFPCLFLEYEWLNIFLYLNFLKEKYFSNCARSYEIWVCMRNKLIGKVRIRRTGSKLIQKFLEKWSMSRACMITKQDWCTGLRLCFKTNHYNSSWFIYLSNFLFSFSYFVDMWKKPIRYFGAYNHNKIFESVVLSRYKIYSFLRHKYFYHSTILIWFSFLNFVQYIRYHILST